MFMVLAFAARFLDLGLQRERAVDDDLLAGLQARHDLDLAREITAA